MQGNIKYDNRFFKQLHKYVNYFINNKSNMSKIEKIKYLTNYIYKYFAHNFEKFNNVNRVSFIQTTYNNGIENLYLMKNCEQTQSIQFYIARMEHYMMIIKHLIETKYILINMKTYNFPVLRRSPRLRSAGKDASWPDGPCVKALKN